MQFWSITFSSTDRNLTSFPKMFMLHPPEPISRSQAALHSAGGVEGKEGRGQRFSPCRSLYLMCASAKVGHCPSSTPEIEAYISGGSEGAVAVHAMKVPYGAPEGLYHMLRVLPTICNPNESPGFVSARDGAAYLSVIVPILREQRQPPARILLQIIARLRRKVEARKEDDAIAGVRKLRHRDIRFGIRAEGGIPVSDVFLAVQRSHAGVVDNLEPGARDRRTGRPRRRRRRTLIGAGESVENAGIGEVVSR